VSPDDIEFLARLLKEQSGLVITPDKSYLLESRLLPVSRKHDMKGLDDLVAKLKTGDDGLITEVTEAMTTNESFFFRDSKPFDLFREHVLPHLMSTRGDKKSFRVWCAAASSGQEPYSLAITLMEEGAKLDGWRYDIVGTDISNQILDKAKAGLYSQFEVQRGLPITLLIKYFEKQDEQWRIKPEIRSMINYRFFNLLSDPASLGKFDVVFCRNVLIYFDQPMKKVILERIASLMPADGMLFLGGAETVLGITQAFRPVAGQRGVYELTGEV